MDLIAFIPKILIINFYFKKSLLHNYYIYMNNYMIEGGVQTTLLQK